MADSQRKTANLCPEYSIISTTYTKAIQSGELIDTLKGLTTNTEYSLSWVYSSNDTSGVGATNQLRLYASGSTLLKIITNGASFSLTSEEMSSISSINAYFGGENTDGSMTNFMLNTGTTALPYEPYGWVHSLRKQCSATETIQSGDTIYANGQPITAYTLKGNEEHTGTPSPQNPVMPNGVGNKTANLCDYSFFTTTRYVTVTPITNGVNLAGTYFAEISGISLNVGTTYYMSWTEETVSGTVYAAWRVQYTDDTYSPLITSGNAITIEKDVSHILFYVNTTNTQASVNITNIMFNSGSTALPYEPYGYKIPILTAQGSAVNYLGSVQTTRQIQKLVLTGQETLSYQVQPPLFLINIPTNYFIPQVTALCTEYKYNPVQSSILANSQHGDFGLQYVNMRDEYNVWFNNSTFATNAEFKAYLATLYANGTPLTVWYVLKEEQTGIVNEPLMKIGTYADSISNATSIPITSGLNTIDVNTSVKPSKMSLTYDGYKICKPKEKSENIYDKYHTIELTGLGTRYGQYVDKGTYSIYNDTNNIVYWFANDGYGRFTACEAHSTATVSLTENYSNFGFFMSYNDASLGDVSIVQGSTVPDHYIPYWK